MNTRVFRAAPQPNVPIFQFFKILARHNQHYRTLMLASLRDGGLTTTAVSDGDYTAASIYRTSKRSIDLPFYFQQPLYC